VVVVYLEEHVERWLERRYGKTLEELSRRP